MAMKRKMTIQSIFWRFLILFCVLTAAILFSFAVAFTIITDTALVYPANYGEIMLEKNRTMIQETKKVTEDLIPAVCQYGVYKEDGTYLYGNLKEKYRERVWQEYKNKAHSAGKLGYLKYYPRDREVCIAVYQLKAEFVNPLLRKYLPGVPESFLIMLILLFIILTIMLTSKFGRIIQKELGNLKQMTEKIQLQDLDFEKTESRIREVDEVMDSLVKMKEALELSLREQWKLEEGRRQQVSALVHDIKTPLTIIRGNTQLLEEAESPEESREYERYILKETDQIEQYIRTLQEMLNSESAMSLKKEIVKIKEVTEQFIDRAKMLADSKGQHLEVAISLYSDYIKSDVQLLQRAWENLLYNASEHTPSGGRILITIEEDKDWLSFQIEDDGTGFTKEDIRHGTEQFYQGDKSRNSRNHYGMGLYIVWSFAKRQGGSLILDNSKDLHGALVRLIMKK